MMVLAAVLALLSLPLSLSAQVQASTGLIRGVVSDSLGRPVEGAIVSLRNRETNATRTHSTNSRGAYAASLLQVGTYDVQARAVGYTAAARNGVAVSLGQAAVVDFQLTRQVTQLAELAVQGASPLVEQTRVAAATRLDTAIVKGLPNNGRNFLNFALLTPNAAIVQGPDGDELSIGGQRGIHNNVSVDGADFNNPFFGEQRGGQRPAFTFNLDAVQEMVVVAQGATAEFGRSSGGFVNVITKSGTNQFRGSAHYFGKYDPFSADYSHTTTAGAKSGFAPDFRQHQFGFTFGGPLKRDLRRV
jgi:hypothetical protein